MCWVLHLRIQMLPEFESCENLSIYQEIVLDHWYMVVRYRLGGRKLHQKHIMYLATPPALSDYSFWFPR
jgi:hypothetical protein